MVHRSYHHEDEESRRIELPTAVYSRTCPLPPTRGTRKAMVCSCGLQRNHEAVVMIEQSYLSVGSEGLDSGPFPTVIQQCIYPLMQMWIVCRLGLDIGLRIKGKQRDGIGESGHALWWCCTHTHTPREIIFDTRAPILLNRQTTNDKRQQTNNKANK